jgi:hypothetical protein
MLMRFSFDPFLTLRWFEFWRRFALVNSSARSSVLTSNFRQGCQDLAFVAVHNCSGPSSCFEGNFWPGPGSTGKGQFLTAKIAHYAYHAQVAPDKTCYYGPSSSDRTYFNSGRLPYNCRYLALVLRDLFLPTKGFETRLRLHSADTPVTLPVAENSRRHSLKS